MRVATEKKASVYTNIRDRPIEWLSLTLLRQNSTCTLATARSSRGATTCTSSLVMHSTSLYALHATTLFTRLFPPRASPRALLRRSRSPSTLRHRAPIRPPSLHMPCHGSSSARGAERPPQPLPTKAHAPPRRHRAGLGAAPRSGRSCASDPRCCASDPRLRFMTQIHDG